MLLPFFFHEKESQDENIKILNNNHEHVLFQNLASNEE
jgi:hypothetical protein